MKNLLLLTITIFTFQLISAQQQNPPSQDKIYQSEDKVYEFTEPDVKPKYPGGMEALYKFVIKNFQQPNKEGLYGKVMPTFIVEIDGSISDIKILKGVGYGSGEEAIRVLKKSGMWIPAEVNGQKVRCLASLSINIDTRW